MNACQFISLKKRQRISLSAVCCNPQASKSGLEINIHGSGAQRFDFLHVEDAAGFISGAEVMPAWPHTVFNVGSGGSISVLCLAKTLNRLADKRRLCPFPLRYLSDLSLEYSRHMELDTHRCRSDFSWSASIPLEEGLDTYLEEMQSCIKF